ncbi:plasmid stabilization protein [Trinickia symbiotica]|uniref:Plasmid stabilization protein n=2 Tax=Burkholderiaceae TaxID=119060 RepID=A0A2N7WPD9_9BURK|nr:plasmid stabilization protein [Trinickia symbiotica]PMS31273.1 plasmid stabilization protein [Trinickia symbiotica]
MRIRERLCVELVGTRREWEAWCMHRGVTAGEGVRQLIAVALDSGGVHSDLDVEAAMPPGTVQDPHARIEVRLTRTELQAVEQRAAASGLTSNRWIAALIRAHLTQAPQLGENELRLLSDSNQHLATINRWLAQLGRNRGAGRLVHDDRPDIAAVRQQIDVHMRAVAAVIRANLDRWSR